MNSTIVFHAVLALAVLSAAAASAIALTGRQRDTARMAVALRLAKLAFICGAALAS
jgi:predicted membrane-bound mannosyltransferase